MNPVEIPTDLATDSNVSAHAFQLYARLTALWGDDFEARLDDIKAATGRSTNGILKCLRELEAAGWVTRTLQREGGVRAPTHYVLHTSRAGKAAELTAV